MYNRNSNQYWKFFLIKTSGNKQKTQSKYIQIKYICICSVPQCHAQLWILNQFSRVTFSMGKLCSIYKLIVPRYHYNRYLDCHFLNLRSISCHVLKTKIHTSPERKLDKVSLIIPQMRNMTSDFLITEQPRLEGTLRDKLVQSLWRTFFEEILSKIFHLWLLHAHAWSPSLTDILNTYADLKFPW